MNPLIQAIEDKRAEYQGYLDGHLAQLKAGTVLVKPLIAHEEAIVTILEQIKQLAIAEQERIVKQLEHDRHVTEIFIDPASLNKDTTLQLYDFIIKLVKGEE